MANPNRNTNTWMTDSGGYKKSAGNTKLPNTAKYQNVSTTANGNTKLPVTAKKAYPNATNGHPKIIHPVVPVTDDNKADDKNKNNNNNNYYRYRNYSSGGSGGGSAAAGDTTNLAALAAALEAQKQARLDAINAANAALDQQAAAMKGRYDLNLKDVANDYQQLRNAAEVNRYRAQYNQREALANRGALDSGAGRQEALALQNNYNNNLNTINTQEAAERANIQQLINEMYANVEQQKADNMTNGLSDYNAALQNLINATYSGYTPEMSNYYQLAANALGGNGLYQKYLQSLGYNV